MAKHLNALSPKIEPSLVERMSAAIHAHIAARVERLKQNLSRVLSLIALAKGLPETPKSQHREDVLRSAVVLLHAAVEDFLRGIASSHLPLADEKALDDVPIAGGGSGSSGRPEKFFLGRLVAHRGKTVDQLIIESVEQHLQQSNYNSATEVATLLRSLRLDIDQAQKTFAKLDLLMKRRHQIVHRADRYTASAGGEEVPQPITPAEVSEWTNTVVEFHGAVLASLALADLSAGRLGLDFQIVVTASPATQTSD